MTPEEAAAISRLLEPAPKVDPHRAYVAVYRWGGKVRLSGRTFETQRAAWSRPDGPNVPGDIQVLDVIDVRIPAHLITSEEIA